MPGRGWTRHIRPPEAKWASSDPLDRGLVGEWRFDRNTGLILPDYSGRDNNAIIVGASWVGSATGPALRIVADTGEYAQVASPVGLPSGDELFCIEALVKFNDNGTGEKHITFWGNKANDEANGLRYTTSNMVAYAWFNDLSANVGDISGAWHVWHCQYDGTDRAILMDGVSINSDQPGPLNVGGGAQTALWIGQREDTVARGLTGDVSSIRIYNRALALGEIRARCEILKRRAHQADLWLPWGKSPIVGGEVCWGHITGVLEENVRTFSGNWTGTGTIENAGDAERLALDSGENMVSEVVSTGAVTCELLQNNYDPTGDDITLEYRHGTTEANCLVAGWNNYTVPFVSLGYVQARVTSTL